MSTRLIESKHNPRLKELRRTLALPGSHPHGLAAVEGPNLVEEALRSGLVVRSVFAELETEKFVDRLRLAASTEVLLAPRALLAQALTTESPQLIAALIEPPVWTWEDLLQKQKNPLIMVLAGLQDPGNLGTILRSAEAFGATGIVSLTGTVSPWNPKAVRASAGSLFRLPLITAAPEDAFAKLRVAGVRIWTTALREAVTAPAADLARPSAILIGNEGNGVPAAIATQADAALTIPCPGPVESLNAAIAASILLYEASRQRAACSPEAAL
jgi:TrmH family RNA methyltransferase